MATWMKTNGECVTVEPKNGSDFTLEELKKFVGGYIEIVHMGESLLVVNEEGKLNGLPVNYAASNLYMREVLVGDVLMCRKEQIK